MNAVANPMSEKPVEFCRYSTTKIDSAVIGPAKAAALLDGKTFQEWLSDLANEESARQLKRKPVHRKPPPPRANKPRPRD